MSSIACFMKITNRFMLLILGLAVSACGGGLVKGEPPLISVSSLSLENGTIRTAVNVYNPNEVEMDLTAITLSLKLDTTDLGRQRRPMDLTIGPRGTEEVRIDLPPNEAAERLLEGLRRGDLLSLPYAMEGTVETVREGSDRFQHQGHLYPVPGRPGWFRGAGPQREKPKE